MSIPLRKFSKAIHAHVSCVYVLLNWGENLKLFNFLDLIHDRKLSDPKYGPGPELSKILKSKLRLQSFLSRHIARTGDLSQNLDLSIFDTPTQVLYLGPHVGFIL